jgi:hypothetical protein
MDPLEAYQPPRSEIPQSAPTASSGKLYSPGQVAAAAFLGAPIGAVILMAANYRLLGRARSRRIALIAGIGGTAALLLVSFFLPEKFPNSALPIAYTIALRTIADRLQGPAYAAHLAAGGARQSHWRVVGIALACLSGLLVLMIAVVLAMGTE